MNEDPQEGISLGSGPVTAWYVVQVKRHEEDRVVRHLALKSVGTFLPLMERRLRRGGAGAADHLEPLFPGYVFIEMPAPGTLPLLPWHLVQWTPGVRRILGSEGTPIPMPAHALEVIRSRVGKLGFVRPGIGYGPGALVRIRRGPLAGLEGIFDRPMSRSGRVRVLVELLGQQSSTEVDVLDLESA